MDGMGKILEGKTVTVNSYSLNQRFNNSNSYCNSKQYSALQIKQFVETLDSRVYRDAHWLAFYCKAARTLGFSRMIELQGMVISDPRIGGPVDKFNPEKVYAALLKEEMAHKIDN
jgi:hypothetical protein